MFNKVSVIILVLCSKIVHNYSIGHGHICNNTEQCGDHRFICLPDGQNISRCACDRFHSWSGKANGCVPIYNVSEIIKMSKTGRKWIFPSTTIDQETAIIDADSTSVFKAQIAAGVFVFTAVILGIISGVIYCIHMEKKDIVLQKSLYQLEKQLREKKRGTKPEATTSGV